MNQLLDKKYLFIVNFVLIPLFIVKLLWSISLFYLDKDLIIFQNSDVRGFSTSSRLAKKILDSSDEKQVVTAIQSGKKITDFKLKGTYVEADSSFIIIENRGNTEFIYLNEDYQGYKLTHVYENKAIFEKDGQNYELNMNTTTSSISSSLTASRSKKPKYTSKNAVPIEVSKEDINYYSQNPTKVWNNIRIEDFRTDSGINFRVSYVRSGSVFSEIGLKPGDVITSIEGQEIQSMGEVMDYYSKIETLESLTLSIKRGSQEMDLEFKVK